MNSTPQVFNALTSTRIVQGPVGPIELLVDMPNARPKGLAIIAHPQPLLGGNALHKIPSLLARASRDLGWCAVRPNFRAVGGTAGVHDHGEGETEDLLAVVNSLGVESPGLPLALIGFSFGAFVQSRVAKRLEEIGRPAQHVVLVAMPVGSVEGARTYNTGEVPPGTVIVHGELDERVPLNRVLQWAGLHPHPVVVVPAADHFFKGRLPVLRDLVVRELSRD